MKVLVTGGAGYIGSTTATALEQAGHVPVIVDSLAYGPRAFVGDRIFYQADIADRSRIGEVLRDHPDIEVVIHMAARVVVPESVADPIAYYRDNVAAALEFFDEVVANGQTRLLFSSSASVYAVPESGFEVCETSAVAPKSPYAQTKMMIERVLEDVSVASEMRSISLRYFNPIGSDPDLRSGIHARTPSHVLGQLLMAASGQIESFTITGTELPTRDGTGMRDYVHVWDLALAHVAAVERFDQVIADSGTRAPVVNVGTGEGTTVRELVSAFERVHGSSVPVVEGPSRPGDAVGAYANVDRATRLLQWRSRSTLDEAIATALNWGRRRREVLGYP